MFHSIIKLVLFQYHKHALTNTFFSTRKGGVSHTFNGTRSINDQKQTDYMLTREAHRSHVNVVNVHPQPPPPTRADSDHNTVNAMVRLSGRFAPNRHMLTKKQVQPFDLKKFRSDGDCRQRVVEQILSKLPSLPSQPSSISEMAEFLAKVVFDAVAKERFHPHHVAHTNSGGASPQKYQQLSK